VIEIVKIKRRLKLWKNLCNKQSKDLKDNKQTIAELKSKLEATQKSLDRFGSDYELSLYALAGLMRYCDLAMEDTSHLYKSIMAMGNKVLSKKPGLYEPIPKDDKRVWQIVIGKDDLEKGRANWPAKEVDNDG